MIPPAQSPKLLGDSGFSGIGPMAKKPQLSLTKLESDVMRAIWEAGTATVRVRDVLERLNDGRARPLAYNTVQTVMTILRDKGALALVRGSGKAHLYRARITREDASRHMTRDLVDRLFDGNVQPLLLQLIDEGELGAAELKRLRKWVDARLRDAEDEP